MSGFGRAGSATAPLALLAVALGLTACGGGGGQSETKLASVGGPIPACANAGPDRGLPAAYPKGFPLPDGAVIDSTREESGFAVAEGFVAGGLEAARDFFDNELPRSGYELGEGDAEEHEAETEFSGNGVDEGRLKLHDVGDCTGALTLELAVKKEAG